MAPSVYDLFLISSQKRCPQKLTGSLRNKTFLVFRILSRIESYFRTSLMLVYWVRSVNGTAVALVAGLLCLQAFQEIESLNERSTSMRLQF